MQLSRIAKKYAKVTVTAKDADGATVTVAGVDVALIPPGTTPTDSTTWAAATYSAGVATVLLAGPDADPDGATVVPNAGADLWIRVVDTPEVDAVRADRITVA